ncbi:MAG: ParB N-terminal domain-containing protein [Mesorhizobium sp.]
MKRAHHSDSNHGAISDSIAATKIVTLPIDQLTPYARNARTHSKKQIRQIADSISRFGFTNPVLIDDRDMILAGHGRVEAAKLLGLKVVPCIRLSAMSEAEKRAYVLADNKLALNAGWDEEILATELQVLLEDVGQIDVSLTGFSVAEIDFLIDGGETGAIPPDDADDAIPPTVSSPVTQIGDVWLLGNHRLVCGDARDAKSYEALMRRSDGSSDLAQMVFTDPPYNVRIGGNVSQSKRLAHREFLMASGEMAPDEF